jgi:hypothetical protein
MKRKRTTQRRKKAKRIKRGGNLWKKVKSGLKKGINIAAKVGTIATRVADMAAPIAGPLAPVVHIAQSMNRGAIKGAVSLANKAL